MYRILWIIFTVVCIAPFVVQAQRNDIYTSPIIPTGQNTVQLDPYADGYLDGLEHDDTTMKEGGDVAEFKAKGLAKHLSIDEKGVGDNCRAGIDAPVPWMIDFENLPTDETTLREVVREALASDTRIRRIRVTDERIQMWFLQPAMRWGFIPMNYYLEIDASGESLRIALTKPKWIDGTENFHTRASSVFAEQVPVLLNQRVLRALEDETLTSRDGYMVYVMSTILGRVNVSPHVNSFFVCYVLPFILYIVLFAIILGIALWFIVRRYRRQKLVQRFRVEHPDMQVGGEDEKDTHHPDFNPHPRIKLPD